ncbi:MAG: response regulator, partial [Desulfuromonadaceae bacterium]|nr:response regulator [Desulfuromonadaceae bacterium]
MMNISAIKILIVDDDVFVRAMLSSILEAGGYSIIMAENGREALEKCLYDESIDLIVSDVN